MTFVIVDIETTGLSKRRHRITEIAAARVKDGKIKEEFHTLVNPGVKIPKFITALTGIDDDLVKDAPPIEDVLSDFVQFLGDSVFVAHNATFDIGFLGHNAEKHHNVVLANEKLCTRKLANRLLPDLPSKKLGSICEHLEITNSQAHRAMGDVQATVQVFNTFLAMLQDQGIDSPEEVIRFERAPRRR